jgi:hypothetical protein
VPGSVLPACPASFQLPSSFYSSLKLSYTWRMPPWLASHALTGVATNSPKTVWSCENACAVPQRSGASMIAGACQKINTASQARQEHASSQTRPSQNRLRGDRRAASTS